MELIIHQRDDVAYVALVGRLDAEGVNEMEEPFAAATSERGLPTVVDMSGISFMSSLGIGFLFANSKKLKKAGAKFVLLNPQEMVETVLRTSKMDRVMPIAHDLDEALKMVLSDAVGIRADNRQEARVAPAPEKIQPSQPISRLKLAIKNEISELKGLYVNVEEFLASISTPHRAAYTVNLALEELVVNIIRYAYMDMDEHLIDIDLSHVHQQLVLVIEDDGMPFDPRQGPTTDLELEEPEEVGGLGLVLVLDMVDVLKYARVGQKNRVEVQIQFRDAVEVPEEVHSDV